MPLSPLLEPRADPAPSGSDLEYDAEFTALERAVQPVAEKQAGNEFIPAEDPDFAFVQNAAIKILERSHDLRAALWLTQARLRLTGFQGFAEGLALMRGMLDQWWDSCHPLLDADDDNDPTARINAVLGLVDSDTTLRGILIAPLAQSATFGRVTLRDVLISSGEIAATEGSGATRDAAAIGAALQDSDSEILLKRYTALQDARRELAEINKIFDEKTPGLGPDFSPLDRHLRRALNRLSEVVGQGSDATDEAAEEGATPEAGAAAPAKSGGPPGSINSLADVRLTIDKIIAYYAEKEPSSPLPILLHRARRLIGADFMTIIDDITPDSSRTVRNIFGLTEDT